MAGTDIHAPASLISMMSSTAGSPWVIIGAFAGSIIFIISETEYTHWAKLGLFTASIIIGVSSSELVASLISHFVFKYLEVKVGVPNSVGATVSAVISVKVLMYISHQKGDEAPVLAKIFKGLKK